MRVLVCGGRNYRDVDHVYKVLDGLRHVTAIIHGGASGADSIGEMWADERGVPPEKFEADWNKHGRVAGPIRNQKMLTVGAPDLVVAFPGGNGTADMVRRAEAAGVKVIRP